MAMTRNYHPVLCLLVTFLAASLLSTGQARDKPTNKQCAGSRNTPIAMKELSSKDRAKLVGEHNKYREIIAAGKESGQPQAKNMIELTWDDSAADQAYEWASGCKFEHNDPKSEDDKPMGQNLYIKMTSNKEDIDTSFKKYVNDMVKGWYDEVKLYTYGAGFSGATGHYTQVVWANTSKVGCGYSYYYQNGSSWYTSYLVCNYFPAGNYFGQNPYEKGSGCDSDGYSTSRKKKTPHLCLKKKGKKGGTK